MNLQIDESMRDEIDKLMFLSMNLRRITLNKIGLYKGQPLILNLIENNPGLSQKEFANLAKVTTPTINVMLNRLSKNGLVEIKYDEKNSKISKVYLTEKGKEKNDSAKKSISEIKKIHYNNFTDEEIETFKKLAQKMINNLENTFKEVDDENN